MKEFVQVHLNYYRVAPKACAGHSSLEAIAACSRKVSQSGLGIRIHVREWRDPTTCQCKHAPPHIFQSHCSACWNAIVAAGDDRREIVERIADRFEVGVHGNSLIRSRHPVFLHICRGGVGKKHISLAKTVLDATARAFKKRGYEVVADGEMV